MRVKTERNAPEMKPRGSRQSARQVHPQHIARLIDTSNPGALRSVVLELCKISPALSGALARGLAPHSTFAQGLIKQQQHASTSRPVKKEDGNDPDSYERMKQRLAGRQSMKGSSANRIQSPSTVADAHRPRYAGSQSAPRMKRAPPPDMGDSDSDLDSFIPGSFSSSVQQAKPDRLSVPDTRSSTVFRAPKLRVPNLTPLSERLARARETPKVKAEKESCTLCHKTIEDDVETCFYHPSVVVDADGDQVCGNCSEPLEDMGCLLGMHVSESEARMSQAGRAESPSKRPRIC